jgi:hypothetical protein
MYASMLIVFLVEEEYQVVILIKTGILLQTDLGT